MEKAVKIKSFDHLLGILEHSENVREFFIRLLGGSLSWKNLTLSNRKDRYGRKCIVVTNEIDGTTKTYTLKSLMSDKYSNIASAIRCEAFYLFDNNENHDKSDVKYY